MDRDDQETCPAGGDAVGIVVHAGAHEERRPRAVAFVWGPPERPTPSLPFGRWKTAVLSAA